MFGGRSVSPLTAVMARPRNRLRYLVVAFIAICVLGIDQVTKTLALDHLGRPVHVIGPFSLQLEFNSGIGFSLGAGFGLPIVLIGFAGLAAFAWRRRHELSLPIAIASGLVLGGALGNLSDRLFRGNGGAVIDFIHTSFWPTFNVADSSVVCGCVMVFIISLRNHERSPERASDSATERVEDD